MLSKSNFSTDRKCEIRPCADEQTVALRKSPTNIVFCMPIDIYVCDNIY